MSDIIYTPPASSGGTTINPTNNFLPVRANATTFNDSLLFQQGGNQALKTVFGGNFNGFVVDDSNKNYILGSYATGNLTYFRVDDNNQFITSFTAGIERMRITSAGNVGIGTSSPAGKLDVVGTTGTVRIETGGNSIAFTRNDANYISAKGGTSSFLVFETGLAESMRINSAGNVGINTTTPFSVSALTLQQSSSLFFALSLRNRNQTQRWDIAIDINAVDDKILGILDGTSGTTRLAITDTGNVGIGTTSPAQSLDVNGLIRSNRASNTDGALILGTTGTYLYAADSGGYLASYTANLERMRITSAGDVGIGTTAPFRKLTINGNTDVYMGFRASGIQTTIGADNIGKFIVYDDTTSLYTFIINSNGQAGIGTTSVNSSAQLQVVSPTNNTGFLCPQLTNAQILAISTPAEGLMVYNTDIAHICFYMAGAWVKISHTPM